MKKYNLINNSLGWLCFVIAAVTYLCTIEPTASFWDCPEFITQGYKLEVGHPPGNPIFMLTARFFITLFGGSAQVASVAVNSMSALLSAGTILLLFWTITHLVKRLIVKDDATEISLPKMLAIMGSGVCGALVYTWSDTFWFSAVEGEVYAFSSFCTALVFWLILKWENRANQPHSDRYLILIAYVIGISIAVHLLNLLCIPAIVLVIYYRKFKETTATGSLIALGISAIIVGLILYGLVPGFVEVAQYFDLFAVNCLGWGYNSGVLLYAILFFAAFIWCIAELYRQRNPLAIKVSFILSVLLSGIPFIGSSMWIPVLIVLGMVLYFFVFCKKLHIRILNITAISILVMFIGYSSYALLLIRSDANPPVNQNSPDNVFALSSYLNREQYGDRPLFYGQTFGSSILYQVTPDGKLDPVVKGYKTSWAKKVKASPDEPDQYVATTPAPDYAMTPGLDMVFTRMYSGKHRNEYLSWANINEADLQQVEVPLYVDSNGEPWRTEYKAKPTFAQNMAFFLNYQLVHMYWRYFMWNFAGRQNDIQGNGEPNHGNWISGIPVIDNLRLGDQSLLPDELGKGNKGHNVFYMLPLILGILGLIWQAFLSKRGIEQFWVIFFLFFMTGIAIVLYLNQTPTQPRERDYAFAGSFYAFAIWVGMGVAAIWWWLSLYLKGKAAKKAPAKASENTENLENSGNAETIGNSESSEGFDEKKSLIWAIVACAIGLFVPIQMVSQTWDDHDRSGRYTTRDFGMNYLSSVGPNGIIFTNGDNDTFPLWYAQEVEGYRTDVRVVNLSYLTTDWYANQQRIPAYDAPAIDMQTPATVYGYDRKQFSYILDPSNDEVSAQAALKWFASPESNQNAYGLPEWKYDRVFVPVDIEKAKANGIITGRESQAAEEALHIYLSEPRATLQDGGLNLSQVLSLDIIATSAAKGFDRPVYFAMTVPDNYYLDFNRYMLNTGLAYQVTPFWTNDPEQYDIPADTERMYDVVMNKFRWGGLDSGKDLYLDETVRRMVTTHRSAIVTLATTLYNEGIELEDNPEIADSVAAADKYAKAIRVLDLMQEKLPTSQSPYSIQVGKEIGDLYVALGAATHDDKVKAKGIKILNDEIMRYAPYYTYYQSLIRSGHYNTLTRVDRYVPTYLMQLIQSYAYSGGDIDELSDQLDEINFDVDGFNQMLQK
ncbi:MAG: DUF2723 domain-containing protein [Bacteroidales bacterium]|nr:DUF2723 domain-containing protein [Bacteroidales bacterium]